MEKQTVSKLGKEYVKAVYSHPTYLTFMQNISCEMPGWMNHTMESRLPGPFSQMALLGPLSQMALCIRWPKYWSFSFSISSSNKPPGLISFRMDWLDLLAVQGTLKSLLQHHSSKASILWRSAFFIVQLSHPYMTTEKP